MAQVVSLLVGAGAERPEPFNLPSGKDYTWSTCYTSNERLYSALRDYYQPKLPNKNVTDSLLPKTYQALFLYEPNNPEFRKLIDSVLLDENGRKCISELGITWKESIEDGGEKAYQLSKDSYQKLFNRLIKRDDDTEDIGALKTFVLGKLPSDAYYGTIEGYFSSVLNPVRRHQSFWRLINYYWSAFFAIIGPLVSRRYSEDRLYKKQGLYHFVLNNLADVIRSITEDDFYSVEEVSQSYYRILSGCFDHVLTTNYTSYAGYVTAEEPIYLSGSIWTFESARTLSLCDIRKEAPDDTDLLFPFLMTQAPIKPIVDSRQIEEYARANDVLKRTDELVILGYSLSNNDTHILNMIRSYLIDEKHSLTFIDYVGDAHSEPEMPEGICSKLRAPIECSERISVITTKPDEINALAGRLKGRRI